MDPDRRLLARVRTRLQATVLVSRLHGLGIPAEVNSSPDGQFEVFVPAQDLPQAQAVLRRLSGSESPAGLLDLRRLIPALLALAALIMLVVALVELLT